MDLTREQVLRYRVTAQELQRVDTPGPLELAVLDLGVQDTGTDGAGWALVTRGVDPRAMAGGNSELVLAWTLRGAPNLYRRRDISGVAAATAPFSEADAGKRIYNANGPLKSAGIPAREALAVVAAHLRDLVTAPMVKGDVSGALRERLPDPYLRFCRVCDAIHVYEMPFRLAALRAGLELRPGTSPPVLEPIAGWTGPSPDVPPSLDVIRAYLHLLGPATPKHVAGYLDAPVTDVKAAWPADAVEVRVAGEVRWILEADRGPLETARVDPDTVRLLSPYDLFLQARDRELLVAPPERRKGIWVALGRPGAVLQGAEIIGTWRPRASGRSLQVLVDTWSPGSQAASQAALLEEGERLAAYRGVSFTGLTDS